MSVTDASTVDWLVVTALNLERLAVRAHLADVRSIRVDGVVADIGRFAAGPGHLTVAVVETGAGNIDAALTVQRAEAALRPRRLVMTGIAGGLKDVAIGDVVASSKVYWVEGGKEVPHVLSRPDQAPVSVDLVQLARVVTADKRWLARAVSTGGGDWPAAGRRPAALVGPIAVTERVLADRSGRTAELIRDSYGDSLCVNMEDFGALRGAAARGRTQLISVRGVSDLLHDKAGTDARGAQPVAAANAAAFVFELVTADVELLPPNAAPLSGNAEPATMLSIAVRLYPEGPLQKAVWERAGGDIARLDLSGAGRTRWWNALRLIDNGGGGLDGDALLRAFAEDYPANAELSALIRRTSH